jgi:acyl-homoserine lactone acylase PvdQ
MRRLSAVCLVAACLFGATLETRRATSATQDAATQSIHIRGLKDRVTISRDERGIPYIEARNDEDLYFAQGYATAADRLWQMDIFRRTERGELAEVLGAGPNNAVLEQDKLHRTYGFAQVGKWRHGDSEKAAGPQLKAFVGPTFCKSFWRTENGRRSVDSLFASVYCPQAYKVLPTGHRSLRAAEHPPTSPI